MGLLDNVQVRVQTIATGAVTDQLFKECFKTKRNALDSEKNEYNYFSI